LTLFVFSLSASNANEVTSELKTAYKNGAKHIILSGVQNRESHIVYNNGTTVDGEGSYSCIFTPEQLKVLSKSSPVYTIVLSLSANSDKYGYLFDTYGYLDKSNITYSERLNPYNYFSDILFSSFVAIDSDTEPNDLSLKPVTKNSRLPKKIDELAITDYQAEMFMRFGYTDVRDDMIKTEISSPEDMIGKTINGLSIVGIYSTEESLEWLKQYDVDFTGTYSSNYTDGYYVNIDNYFYNWTQSDFHMIKTGFVSSEWSEIFDCTQVLYKLSGKISTDKKLINDISFDEVITYDGELTANTTKLYYIKNHYTATVATAYSGFTEAAWMFTNEIFLKATLYAGIGISLFSALLLMNFLLVLVDARKYEIGVLRVLGARKRDAVNICLVESMTVALVEYLLTLITGSLICLLINNYYNFYLFNLGVMPIVFLTILCFGIAVFATIIPILKILKKQPIKIVH
jgi:ABC-type antimicrobial peptide transport system permease subunit